jgi:YbbR domain-containing protein
MRLWGLRALALAIAVALWYSVSFEERETLSERIVAASVSYNRPRGFVILEQVPSVNVRLRGSAKKIRQLSPFQVNVQVELIQAQKGVVNLTLSADDVQVPEDFEVVSIDPNVIRVELDREVTQRIPVDVQLVGKPADGGQLGEVEILPNQVQVTGPESMLAKIQSLATLPVSVDGHSITFEETVPVLPPNPLVQVVLPSNVSVRVTITPPADPDGGPPSAERPRP